MSVSIFFFRKFCLTLVVSYVFFKLLRRKLARGCQKMYPFAHARRLTAVFPSPHLTERLRGPIRKDNFLKRNCEKLCLLNWVSFFLVSLHSGSPVMRDY